jgi:anthranilate phosphoribosyltransferase
LLRELLSSYIDTPATHMLCLNAGAALQACEQVDTLAEGVKLAQETLRAGKAQQKLAEFIASTQAHGKVSHVS